MYVCMYYVRHVCMYVYFGRDWRECGGRMQVCMYVFMYYVRHAYVCMHV